VLWLAVVSLNAADNSSLGNDSPFSPALQRLLDSTVADALKQFADAQLKSNQVAVTLIDLRTPAKPVRASYRGDVQIYPASVIKLFYLVAAHRWMEDSKLPDTPELRRAMKDMIVHSYNEATHYVIDLLTGTTSGPELPDAELDEWFQKRNSVNRYFAGLGYTDINANKKPWCEGPYGRETQSIKRHQPKRNMLTTDSTARLLNAIVTGNCITAKRSTEMMELLKRDPFTSRTDPDDQAVGYTGGALPNGAKLWSKAGWTSEVRHDAAHVELPTGERFILVTFTTNHSENRAIIPALAKRIVRGLPGVSTK
jgi:beta-lactamase class A